VRWTLRSSWSPWLGLQACATGTGLETPLWTQSNLFSACHVLSHSSRDLRAVLTSVLTQPWWGLPMSLCCEKPRHGEFKLPDSKGQSLLWIGAPLALNYSGSPSDIPGSRCVFEGCSCFTTAMVWSISPDEH
jgi:hypothetical protein